MAKNKAPRRARFIAAIRENDNSFIGHLDDGRYRYGNKILGNMVDTAQPPVDVSTMSNDDFDDYVDSVVFR